MGIRSSVLERLLGPPKSNGASRRELKKSGDGALNSQLFLNHHQRHQARQRRGKSGRRDMARSE